MPIYKLQIRNSLIGITFADWHHSFSFFFKLAARSLLSVSKYFSSRLRSETLRKSPRRDEKSFLCWVKCSWRSSISADKSAICTSGDPVSPLWVANFSITFPFFFLSNIFFCDPLIQVGRCWLRQTERSAKPVKFKIKRVYHKARIVARAVVEVRLAINMVRP